MDGCGNVNGDKRTIGAEPVLGESDAEPDEEEVGVPS